MRSPLFLATTVSVLLVAATGCGTSSSSADGAAPPTTPTTAGAPTTSDPTTPPRPTDTVNLVIDDGSFDSVAEMGDTASLVVVGDVVEITSLGRPYLDRDPNAYEMVQVTVQTVDTLEGTPTGEIVFAWQAFATDAEGNRTATVLTNGIRPPDLADRLVLFVTPVDPAFAEFVGGDLTHQLVKLDRIAYLDGERVITGEIGSPAAEDLLTMTLSEIRDAVAT